MTFQWRGQDYLSEGSGNGIAATLTHGGVSMIIKVSHYDDQYALEEAIDDFIAKCDARRQWRAVAAARRLQDQITRQKRNKKSERLASLGITPSHDG